LVEKIREQMEEHMSVIADILENDVLSGKIRDIIDLIVRCYNSGNKVILFGCGGSAADSQHLAAEFINKLSIERKCLPAIALTTDTSVLTALGNDSEFSCIFSRQVEGIAIENDVVIGFSTSGTSQSVIQGLRAAKNKKAATIALTGKNDGGLAEVSDHIINVPSLSTPRIQEAHILIGHIICASVESELFDERI